MRQWHRWLGICFALFLAVISITGVAVQVLDVVGNKPAASRAMSARARAASGAGAEAGADMAGLPTGAADDTLPQAGRVPTTTSAATLAGAAPDTSLSTLTRKKPKLTGLRAWSHGIKDIHSGRMFGPLGTVLSILSGIAMMFFSLSGIWMYARMFAQRKSAGRGAFFWKR